MISMQYQAMRSCLFPKGIQEIAGPSISTDSGKKPAKALISRRMGRSGICTQESALVLEGASKAGGCSQGLF